MLLSTMLIGTVSTVSAAGSKTVYLLDKASWGAGYAYCWSDSVENSGWPGVKMDVVGKQDGHTIIPTHLLNRMLMLFLITIIKKNRQPN